LALFYKRERVEQRVTQVHPKRNADRNKSMY
jgi:hypothetical protein